MKSNANAGAGRHLSRSALAAAVAAVALPSAVWASVSFTGANITENFNTLSSSGSTALSATIGVQLPIPGFTNWDCVKNAGTGVTAMNFVANNGTMNSGALYSYGATGDTERALGSLASGSNTPAFGVEIVNNSSFAITSFTLTFTAEQWRSSTSVLNKLAFGYGVSGGSINNTNYLSIGDMTAFTSLDAPGKAAVPDPNAATNGNDPAYQTLVSASVSVNVPIGASLFIRWQDSNDTGNDAGIGIDDLTFSAIGGAKNLIWNPPGSNWNTAPANTNWLDGATPSAFSNNDVVNFTDAGLAQGSTVNVDPGGVNPGNINVSNTSGTYTFTGGPIGGTGILTKTNGGTLNIQTSNSFAGVIINDGVVVVSSDANLGAAAGGITMNGGTLRLNGNVTSSRTIITATIGNTAAVNTNGNTATFGAISGSGDFRKEGAGSLVLSGAFNVWGYTQVNAGALVLAQTTGTSNIIADFGSPFAGDLVIVNGVRVNFNNGDFAGGGKIKVQSSGAILSTDGAAPGRTPVIGNDIQLNSNNISGPFVTTIGATGGSTMTINGVISGNSGVSYTSSTPGAGTGIVLLNNNNTYTGDSTINFAVAGVVRLGVNNALPTTSALIFGSGTTNAGALDLAGRNQQVAGLRVATTGTVNGVANTGGSTSTLTVVVPSGNDDVYSSRIGIPAVVTNLPGANDNIALVKGGAGTLQLTGTNTYVGGTTVTDGTLIVGNVNAIGNGALSVTGGTAKLNAGMTTALKVTGLGASGSGKVDITDNDMVVDYSGASPIGSIRVAAQAGRLMTSATIPTGTAIGYGEATVVNPPGGVFSGVTVDSDMVLITITYQGDTNLDGQVDITDLGTLATNWQAGGRLWTDGDFDYSGVIDITDLGMLATNWQAGVGGPLGPSLGEAFAALGLPGVSVPEPTSLALLGLGAMALRRRRIM